jgi:hypothetical protein
MAHLRRQVTFTYIPQDSPIFHVHVTEVKKKKKKKEEEEEKKKKRKKKKKKKKKRIIWNSL